MVPQVEIKIDEAKVKQVESALKGHEKALPKIMYRSLKRTASAGRTQIDRGVRAEVMLKKKNVMNRIQDLEKATDFHWVWRLGISLERLTLAAFGNVTESKKGKGVSYTIKRGLRKLHRHAFITKGFHHYKSGEYIESKTVWQRGRYRLGTEKAVRKKREYLPSGRLKLREALIVPRGPSIGWIMETGPLLKQVEKEGVAVLSKEIDRQVKRELEKRMPR